MAKRKGKDKRRRAVDVTVFDDPINESSEPAFNVAKDVVEGAFMHESSDAIRDQRDLALFKLGIVDKQLVEAEGRVTELRSEREAITTTLEGLAAVMKRRG